MHEAPDASKPDKASGGGPPRGLVVLIALGILLLELGFIASYVGGLHAPKPQDIPVAVVGSPQQVSQLEASLTGSPAEDVVSLTPSASLDAAKSSIRGRDADGAYDPQTATLVVASGRGTALTEVLTGVFTPVAAQTQQKLTQVDIAPVGSGDPRGLTSFYLIIGWAVGGYLFAAVVGILAGMTPRNPAAALSRLILTAGYSIASGIAGALIVVTGYGYVDASLWAVAGLGALIVFGIAAFTAGLESVLGLVGTGLVIILFVILGNPSAGGPWPIDMLPSPWREMGPWLPNGAGVTALRQITFFSGDAIIGPMLLISAYAVVGIVLTVALSARGRPYLDLARISAAHS